MKEKYRQFYRSFHKGFQDRDPNVYSVLVDDCGIEMKVTVSLLFYLIFLSPVVYGSYDGWKRNPDGSYSVGGCYDGWKRNPDGSYSVGGMYDGWKRNPDGSYSVGGIYDGWKRNPDGSYVLGWKCFK